VDFSALTRCLAAQRIYECNAAVTGYHDGESLAANYQSECGSVEAGASGYMWGGCCYVSYLLGGWALNC
jgi:hypothetical protein